MRGRVVKLCQQGLACWHLRSLGMKIMPLVRFCGALAIAAGLVCVAGASATAENWGGGILRPPVVRHAPLPCNGISGLYNDGSTINVAKDGRSVQVMVNPRRPLAFGTCRGNRITVNFRDDRVISGVFDGRTIFWDNRTTWVKR